MSSTATTANTAKVEKKEMIAAKPKDKAKAKDKAITYSLRFKSTGLGTTMMEGEPDGFDVIGDMLIVYTQTTTPTRWHVRTGLTYKGVMTILRQAMCWKVIKFMLFGWIRAGKPRLTQDF